MGEPRRRPAETQTPQLTEDQVRTRAQNAFDTSLNNVIRAQFSARPPPAEITALRNLVDQMGGEDITPAVRRYAEQNPNSTIARYFNFTGSSGWLLTPTGTIGFNQTQLASDVRTVVSGIRAQVATSYVGLYNQSRRQNPDYTFSDIPLSPLGTIASAVLGGMVQQTNSGPNAVPIFIASESQNTTGALRIALKESRVTTG